MINPHHALKDVPKLYPLLTERHLRRLVHERRIPFTKVAGRIFFAEADLDTFIHASRVEATRESTDHQAATTDGAT